MELIFGTDGVRGLAFAELDEVVAHGIGRAANRALFADKNAAQWVVGRDTRESGFALQSALVGGLRATGAQVIDLGIVPTPVVAFAAQHLNTAGVMVSASHNPWHDNGIKLFAPGGLKLNDTTQHAVAQCLRDLGLTHAERPSATDLARRVQLGSAQLDGNQLGFGPLAGGQLGDAQTGGDPPYPPTRADCLIDSATIGNASAFADSLTLVHHAYEASLREAIGGRSLDGVHAVVDGANGASSSLAPVVLQRLGAQVTAIFCDPDGRNINEGCGSVRPDALRAAVLNLGADIGLAFDGDGDRLIAVDSDGLVIDGDRLMALFAVDLDERGLLRGNTLVVTVMSNLGLRQAMKAANITVVETAVGDRAVLEALDAGHHSLGGEQSGHIVFRREATTGDGLRSAVHLVDLIARRCAEDSSRTSAQLAHRAMQAAPQVLRSVSMRPASLTNSVRRAVDDLAARAGPQVRVLVRPSGTEPVIRVMVEAPTQQAAHELADRLVALVATRMDTADEAAH